MDATLRVGDVEILSLTDGTIEFATPLTDVYPEVSFASWEPYRQRYPEVFAAPNAWRIHLGCYLVQSSGQTILVDTGLGPEPNARFMGPTGTLLAEMKVAGISPASVDLVFVTHSHADHIGWNLTPDGAPVFPNARYVMSRKEWDWVPGRIAAGAPGMAVAAQQMIPLGGLDRVDLLDGDSDLTNDVRAIETPGHTPGHMSLLVSSQGEKACITGDAIVHPAQLSEPDWHVRMDFDGDAAAATRSRLIDLIESEGMRIVSCHFPRPGYGNIIQLEGRRYWQAR